MSLKHLILPHTLWPKTDVLHSTLNYEWARWINLEYFWFFHFVRYRGQENIPTQGAVIFAPNHVSYYDPTIVAAGIPYKMRFMAWDALFKVPVLKTILESYGAFPVRLGTIDKKSITHTLNVLKNKEVVMIFPEGKRGSGDGMLDLEPGVARMALQTDAAIVPVTITGMREAWPPHRALPYLFKPITIKFHPPVRPPVDVSREQMKETLDQINEKIRQPVVQRLHAWDRCLRGRKHGDSQEISNSQSAEASPPEQ